MKVEVAGRILELIRGDITEQSTDAIVNAANSKLQLGAGVAGAIRSKGGAKIQAECDRIGGTPVGTAVITGGGKLKAKYVIHAVGPRMGEGDEDAKLAGATRSSLEVAAARGLKSVTFPAISTGIFGFPIDRAAAVMLAEAAAFLKRPSSLEKVMFCLYTEEDFRVFSDCLAALTPSCG